MVAFATPIMKLNGGTRSFAMVVFWQSSVHIPDNHWPYARSLISILWVRSYRKIGIYCFSDWKSRWTFQKSTQHHILTDHLKMSCVVDMGATLFDNGTNELLCCSPHWVAAKTRGWAEDSDQNCNGWWKLC